MHDILFSLFENNFTDIATSFNGILFYNLNIYFSNNDQQSICFSDKASSRFYIPEDDEKEYGIKNLPSLKKFKKNTF